MSADDQLTRNVAGQSDLLSGLRAEHVEMMRQARREGRSDDMVQRSRTFIDRVKTAGARIDSEAARDAAQDIITYWASYLYTAGDEEALKAALPTLDPFDPANAPDLSTQSNPYHGLAAFSEDDAGRFFGREDEVKAIIDKLRDQPVILISGPAGSGKTSIVAAGIVPRLKLRLIAKDRNPVILVVRPGADPFAALCRGIHAATDHSLPELGAWISEQKPRLERAPAQLRALLDATFPGRPVILVVDDFEQLLAACPDAKTREQFAQALLGVCSDPRSPDRTILIVDEQYEHAVLQLAALTPLAGNPVARFALPPFTAAEVQRVIEGGAAAVGLKFDEGIVEDLAKDVAGDARAPPTLQFTLGKLWNERQRNRITWDAYAKVGKPREALKGTADAVFESLSFDEQQIARKLFLALVQPGSEGNFIRRRVRRDVLAQIGPQDVAARVVTRYVEAGLIRQTAGIEWDDDRFDVPHEALATGWARLRDWLQSERRDSEKKLQLIAMARRWQESRFERSYLLSGAALEEAEAYTQAAPELGLLVAMSRDEGRRARRRAFVRRTVMSVMALLLAVSLISLFQAWKATEKAQQSAQNANMALIGFSEMLHALDDVDEGIGILPLANARDETKIAQSTLRSLGQQPELELASVRIELLVQLSDVSRWDGDWEQAYRYATSAEAAADDYVKEKPNDEKGQRLLYESEWRIGRLDKDKDPEAAKSKYERALQIARKWASEKPDDAAWQQRLASIEYRMGDLFRGQDPDQSLQWFKKGLAFSEQQDRKAKPESRPAWQRLVRDGHFFIGELHADQNHLEEADAEYRTALKIAESLVDDHPQNRYYQYNLSLIYFAMGKLYKSESNLGEARAQYVKSLKLVDELTRYEPDPPVWQDHRALLHAFLADINIRQHHIDDALKEYDIALQSRRELAERLPDDSDRQRNLAHEYDNKGSAYKERGESRNNRDDLRKAADAYKQGMEIIDKFKPKNPKDWSSLEQTRKELQEKIQNLPSDLR